MILIKFRLVVQARENHPGGIYSGTDRKYVLQVKVDGERRWRTCPVVDWDTLTPEEKIETQ